MGLLSTIFGKAPKAPSSESGNKSYDWMKSNYGSWAPMGTNAMSAMSSMLLGGGGGGTSGTPGQTVDMWHDGIHGNAKAAQKAGLPTFYTVGGTEGTPGSGTGNGGFDNYLDSSAYKFVRDEALGGLTNSAAGNYLLRSGSTAKALEDRAANIGKTYFDNYLNHLTDMSKLSLGAGGLVGNAGQYSKQSGGTQGSGGLLGAAMQFLPLFI